MATAPDTPAEDQWMTALFECNNCQHGWISVRSLKLPEECEECKTEVQKPLIYRKSTKQEKMLGRKMIMVALYKCDKCKAKWRKTNSSGKPMACPTCTERGSTNIVEPYQYQSETKTKPQRRRLFGHFKCKCGREWKSAQTWEGMRQGCLTCKLMIHPYLTAPLQYSGGADGGISPHQQDLCEMCQTLGRNCKDYVPPAQDSSDVIDDASVFSFMTNSSTSTGRRQDDDTPRNSDTEDELGGRFGNLGLGD